MGGCQKLHPAAPCTDQRPGIGLGGDLIYGNIVRSHGSQNHSNADFFFAAGKHVQPLPGLKALWKQLSPAVHHGHGSASRKAAAQVPQEGGLPPSGGAQNQHRPKICTFRRGNAPDIPGHPQAQGADAAKPRNVRPFRHRLTAHPHAVASGDG